MSVEASQLSRSAPFTKRPASPSGRDGGTVSGRSAKKPGTVVWMSTPPSEAALYDVFGSGVHVTPSVENDGMRPVAPVMCSLTGAPNVVTGVDVSVSVTVSCTA